MSLLSAFAAIVRGSDQFEERVSTVLQRELAEPTVEVSAPSPIEEARAREPEPLSEPEPQKATMRTDENNLVLVNTVLRRLSVMSAVFVATIVPKHRVHRNQI
jgi:hypothetical protein